MHRPRLNRHAESEADLKSIALLNITGTIPGPLNVDYYLPFTAPNTSAVGAGGQGVFLAQGLNTSLTATSLAAPANLTAQGQTNPWGVDPGINYANGTKVIESPTASSTSPGGGSNAAVGARAGAEAALFVGLGVVCGVAMVF